MNRRTFTASLAGLLGLVGTGAKAKAAPKLTGRTLNAHGPVTLTAEAGDFDTVNIYPGGSVSFEGGPKLAMHSPTGRITMHEPRFVRSLTRIDYD